MERKPSNSEPGQAPATGGTTEGTRYGRHARLSDDLFSLQAYSARGRQVASSGIDKIFSLLDRTDRDIISFVAGSPDPEMLPLETLGNLAAELFDSGDTSFLNYGVVEGEHYLRTFLAAKFRDEGVPADEDNVTITTGGVQGIDLTCRFVLEPGDPVIVESPCYSNTLAAVLNNQGRLVPVEMAYDGIEMEGVQRELAHQAEAGRPVRLIIVNPTFQNPTGITMTLQRRKQLLELARRYNAVVLEDDPYRPLRFTGPPQPLLLALDGGSHVIHSSTFAKTISPGLRVGYVVAAKGMIDRLIKVRSTVDNGTNVLGQRLVHLFSERGYLGPQVDRMIKTYRAKKDAMISELEGHFGADSRIKWTNPDGGFFVWLTLEPEAVSEEVLDYAMAEGVAFVPGSAFDVHKLQTNSLRLSYSYPSIPEIAEGIRRLATALNQYRKDRQRT